MRKADINLVNDLCANNYMAKVFLLLADIPFERGETKYNSFKSVMRQECFGRKFQLIVNDCDQDFQVKKAGYVEVNMYVLGSKEYGGERDYYFYDTFLFRKWDLQEYNEWYVDMFKYLQIIDYMKEKAPACSNSLNKPELVREFIQTILEEKEEELNKWDNYTLSERLHIIEAFAASNSYPELPDE